MRIVSISDDFLERFAAGDREFMQKYGRPCLLVVRLKFRGKRRDFAVPFRSNIAPNVPKDQYFALPPSSVDEAAVQAWNPLHQNVPRREASPS